MAASLGEDAGNAPEVATARASSLFFLIVLLTILLGYWIRQTRYKYATEVRLGAQAGGMKHACASMHV